jgi:hypothetical protein
VTLVGIVGAPFAIPAIVVGHVNIVRSRRVSDEYWPPPLVLLAVPKERTA